MKLDLMGALGLRRGGDIEPLGGYAASGHLQATNDGVWAWYALGGQDILGRSGAHRAAVSRAQAARWGELCGLRVRLRQTSSPFAHREWARRIDVTHPDPRLPHTDQTVTHRLADHEAGDFARLLAAGQTYAGGTGRRKSGTVLGVRISTRRVKDIEDLDVLLRDEPVASTKLETARAERARIDTAVARPGFDAVPLATNSLDWLIHASLGMGAPVPPVLVNHPGRSSWDMDEVPGFTNPVRAVSDPYSLTCAVTTTRDSRIYTSHVATLVVDRFMDRDDGATSFLAWTLAYPRALEVVAEFDVIDGKTLKRAAEKNLRKAKDIEDHNLEHGDDPPRDVERGIALALEIRDQFNTGDTPTRTRLHGTWAVAVVSDTAHGAESAARDLRVAAESEASVIMTHDFGQYRWWRAFVPGEPFPVTGGHVCRVPAKFAAAALMPNVSVECGDPTGVLIGPVYGGHDLMVHDVHGGALRNLPSVQLTCGNPGSGKSALAGMLLWWTARLGIRTLAVDPSGPWKRLTELPDLKADSHFLDVAQTATAGTLVPSVLVPQPRRRDYAGEPEWRSAMADAAASRTELMVDTLHGLLPWGWRQVEQKLGAVLTVACSEVGGAYGEDPWRYVDQLRRHGDLGNETAGLLEAAALGRGGRLVFPERGTEVDPEKARRELNRATFTVISTHGLAQPPQGNTDRALWTPAQQAAIPIQNLVAYLAMLAMYEDRESPKNITVDELRLIANVGGSFHSLINRASVDSRKWNAFIHLLFQSPSMMTDLEPNIGNLTGSAWIGRLDEKDAEAARPLLRDDGDDDSGIAARIADQTAGEFHVRDWLGRRRQVYVDQTWWPAHLYAALDTTPGKHRAYDDSAASLFGVPA